MFSLALPCFLKWVLSVVLAVVGPLVGFAVLLVGAVLVSEVINRATKSEPGATIISVWSWVLDKMPFVIFGGLILLLLYAGSIQVMSSVFGCDDCLPRWAQDSCHVVAPSEQERKDRIEYDMLQQKYGWR